MIAASVGTSDNIDSYRAGKDACEQALGGLPDRKANALIVFGSVSYDQDKLIEGVVSAAPVTLVVGCSTAGEISSEGQVSEKSVVVMAIQSDQVKFVGGVGNHILWNPRQAGSECADQLIENKEGAVSSALLFTDVISGDGDATLSGYLEHAKDDTSLFGGAAGDDGLFFQTYQYLNDKAYKGSIVGLGLVGDYHSSGSMKHGFLPIGIARTVTKSEGIILHELDHLPASHVYKDYFGEEHLHDLHKGLLTTLAIAYPLGIFLPESDEVILRNPLFVSKEGAMTLTGTVPVGAQVRLMISDIERSLETVEVAAKEALLGLEGRTPKAIIVVDSVARKKMLGLRADEEIEVIQRIFGRDVPIAGFYSYAQMGGIKGESISLQNGSILIWVLAE